MSYLPKHEIIQRISKLKLKDPKEYEALTAFFLFEEFNTGTNDLPRCAINYSMSNLSLLNLINQINTMRI